jgi:TetR/AcrR family transcriptional regulator
MPSTQFAKLPAERQAEILDAGLREFAEYGYDLASTNRITRSLGISKGVLFKYFTDKAGFFFAVCDCGMREYAEAVVVRPYDDLFQCIKEVSIQKLRWLRDRPLTYRLVMRIFKEPKHPAYARVLTQASGVSQSYAAAIQALLPRRGLRRGVSPEHVLSAITWISQGLEEKYFAAFPQQVGGAFDTFYDRLSKEIDGYFDIIRNGIYRVDAHKRRVQNARGK